jgi:Multiple antibiotic transporter
VLHVAAIVGCGLAVGVITWIALRVATRVGRYMSRTSINVATRLMGLLLAALAVEIFAGGAHELWTNLRIE